MYCTRTIAELNQCMEELKRVIAYRRSVLENRYTPIYGVCLSSRRNLCIHSAIDRKNAEVKVDISNTLQFVQSFIVGCLPLQDSQHGAASERPKSLLRH